MTSFGDANAILEGWPVQRLRMGWALVLFYFFEVHIGKSLPQVMAFIALGMGIACLVSAMTAIREMKLQAEIADRVDEIDRS
jgi:hypothetical protein